MAKEPDEWLRQSDYDFDTAGIMRRSGRNFYSVFMCHMAVEKALKAILFKMTGEIPPKTHNLLFLMGKSKIKPPSSIGLNIAKLSEANVATRYPEELAELIKNYTDTATDEVISQTRDTLAWIKSAL